MKKIVVILSVVGLVCASVSPLWAGGIINKSNLSADYFRSLTRHASTDAADIVAYNPAGVMKMENGFYTKLDILYINKDYENDVPNNPLPYTGEDGNFKSDEPSIVPGFFTVYKQDKWAGFFAVTVPGGGGKVKYEDGDARTSALALSLNYNPASPVAGLYTGVSDMYLEADSFAIGYTLGGAYEINSIFSVAGGLRYINATQKFKGRANLIGIAPGVPSLFEVDLERDATGWGYFLGMNITPTDKLNFGLLYQSNTDLDYKSSVTKDDPGVTRVLGWEDGTKQREDLPGILAAGVSYKFTPKIRMEVDYTRYLESNATLEESRFSSPSDPGDSWEVGTSITYTFNPQWRASVGYLYTDIQGMDVNSLLVEAPELDAKTIGLGAVYSPTNRLDISFGYTDVSYDSQTTTATPFSSRAPVGTELKKHVWAVSFGAQYRWF